MYNFLAAEPASAGASLFNLLWPLALMFVIFYFLLIRPQQKRQKQRNMMLLNLSKGDKIVTIGGLHATIVELTDDTAVIRVNDATKLTVDRSAINTVRSQEDKSEA